MLLSIFNFNFKAPKALESLGTVFSDPKIYITLLCLVGLVAALLAFRKIKLDAKTMTYVGIAIALGTILKMFTIMKMPNGGSVTLGSMIPIIFIAYIYGPRIGILGGLLFGIIDLMLGAYVVHPLQLLLDYTFAFMSLGLAGYFRNNVTLGAFIAILGRYICHVLSGVIFFAEYANGQNPLIYSLIYNSTYLVPELIITVVVLNILPLKRIQSNLARSY